MDLYISVYAFSQVDEIGGLNRQSAIIDKVFFDFDANWREDIYKFHEWCIKYNILHYCQFSGRGSQGLLFTAQNVNNKKQTVANFQRWLGNEIGIECDPKIIGDIARIFRYPNTYNFKGSRYCVPLSTEILSKQRSEEWFYEYAAHQHFESGYSGNLLLNLKRWDIDEYLFVDYTAIDSNLMEIDEQIEIEYGLFPPCVKTWLSTPTLNGEGKFMLVLYLKDQLATDVPYSGEEIVSILKQTLLPVEFSHYFGTGMLRRHSGHTGRKFYSIMQKDYYMPNCEEIRKKGFCPEDCGRRNPIYD